jgi:hypothetical protein
MFVITHRSITFSTAALFSVFVSPAVTSSNSMSPTGRERRSRNLRVALRRQFLSRLQPRTEILLSVVQEVRQHGTFGWVDVTPRTA